MAATSGETGSVYKHPFPVGRGGAANGPIIASTSAAGIQPQASDGGAASGTWLGAFVFPLGAPACRVVALDALAAVRAVSTGA